MSEHILDQGYFEIVEIRHQDALDKCPVFRPNKKPYAYIQLHNSDICITINCECGESGHVDGEFVNLVRCTNCKRVYNLVPYIKLVELDSDVAKFAKSFTEA